MEIHTQEKMWLLEHVSVIFFSFSFFFFFFLFLERIPNLEWFAVHIRWNCVYPQPCPLNFGKICFLRLKSLANGLLTRFGPSASSCLAGARFASNGAHSPPLC